MKRPSSFWVLVALAGALVALSGCHARPDDPAGQAQELADPVRRQNALKNLETLYTSALAAAQRETQGTENDPRGLEEVTVDGRKRQGPKAVADASIEELVRTYVSHREDNQNGRRIIALLREMRDLRALPAFKKALEWQTEVNEDHAVEAAQGIEELEIPESEKGELIEALSTALDRIQNNRGADNRMRIHFIRTLRDLDDRRSAPILMKITTRMAEDQAFAINRLAAEALADLGDPEAVSTMIKALFLFSEKNPLERMNDIGSQGLVQIGAPALEPTLALLRGENEEAERIATAYINTVRSRDPAAAAMMDPRTLVIEEACISLGQLGMRAAIETMMEQLRPLTSMSVREATAGGEELRQRYARALNCTTALIQISREDADTPELRRTLLDVYQRIPEEWPPEAPGAIRMQLLSATVRTYDPGLLDFLHRIAADRNTVPDFRLLAASNYSFLAGKDDVARLRRVIEAEPAASQLRKAFEESNPALDAAVECDEDLACYRGKLADSNPTVVRKAAYMIARFGRGNAEALADLVQRIDHSNAHVRGEVLYAIDWIATQGSPEAVAAIDRIRAAEEGRSSWNQIASLAMSVRARLQARSGS